MAAIRSERLHATKLQPNGRRSLVIAEKFGPERTRTMWAQHLVQAALWKSRVPCILVLLIKFSLFIWEGSVLVGALLKCPKRPSLRAKPRAKQCAAARPS